MKPESLVFATAGVFLGLIAGWIIGSQQGTRSATAIPAGAAPAQASTPASAAPAATLDQAKVDQYTRQAAAEPNSSAPRVILGNLYMDAERYDEAVTWYEQALALDPRNPDVSTDLGVSYYYLNQADRALAQFDRSLKIDPTHTKTMLNMGIVRAFGKQDLEGAATVWQQVLSLAPNSPEGQAARRALDALKNAHPGIGAPSAAPGTD
jgi:cytochrome c-type biogenesis protein CcmH/NrfG